MRVDQLPDDVLEMAQRLARLSPLARRAMSHVIGRLEIGQQRYGAPDPRRNWKIEKFEELLDLVVYPGLELACAEIEALPDVERGLRELVANAPPTLPVPVYSCTFPSTTACVCQQRGCTGCTPGGFGIA